MSGAHPTPPPAEPAANDPAPDRAALAMLRIAHSVRRTLMLETIFDQDYRARLRREQGRQPQRPVSPAGARAAAPDRQAEGDAAITRERRKRNMAKARCSVSNVIERGEQGENDGYAELSDLPPAAIVVQIRQDLGVAPNWRYWALEDCAADPAETNLRDWPGEPDAHDDPEEAAPAEGGPLPALATVPWRSGDG